MWNFRNPTKLVIPKGSGGSDAGTPLANPNLTVIGGDVTNLADVSKVFETSAGPIDGVIVALGGKTSDVGETMLTDGTNNVIAAMKAKGVKRLVVVTVRFVDDTNVPTHMYCKRRLCVSYRNRNGTMHYLPLHVLKLCVLLLGMFCTCIND